VILLVTPPAESVGDRPEPRKATHRRGARRGATAMVAISAIGYLGKATQKSAQHSADAISKAINGK
jgi:hypothetical protein